MDDESNKVLATLKANKGNYEMASKFLHIPMDRVREIDVRENKLFNYTPEGKGRVEMKSYVIATRHVINRDGWDNRDPKIVEARRLYDAGLVEMVTGRDGMQLVLYAIPRRYKIARKPYFGSVAHG